MTPFTLVSVRVVMAVASAAMPAAATSAPTTFQCPARLVQQPVADGLPQGWVVQGPPGELLLQRAAFYDGDPVGLGTLAPDTTRRNGLTETSTWSFQADVSAHVWLGCLYRDAAAVVARPLPGGLQQCTTVLRLNPMGDPTETLSVQCR